jgi:hypothetical protein
VIININHRRLALGLSEKFTLLSRRRFEFGPAAGIDLCYNEIEWWHADCL